MRNRLTAAVALAAALLLFGARAEASRFVKGPYIQSLTDTGVTIMWETDVVEDAKVEWGPTGDLGRTIHTRGHPTLAAVRISGLEPDTTYYYRVTEGDTMSHAYAFRTLPDRGPFRFVAYGDSRSNPTAFALLNTRVAGVRPAFILHVGDLVANGANALQWDRMFFEPAQPLIARYCMYTVPGNHEQENPLYYQYLGGHYLGDNTGPSWYSFDCADAHFVMLNSCIDITPESDQYKWLVKDLASTTKRWRFVTLHHPLYSSASHGSNMRLREVLEPLFQRYAVDVVFQGHDHDYERTWPIVSALGGGRPVTYVVTGGAGAPLYRVKGASFTAFAKSVRNYCVIDIEDEVMKLTAYDEDGRAFDSFSIIKAGRHVANAYDAKAMTSEVAALCDAVAGAAAAPKVTEGERGARRATFTFAAPEWSDMTLECEWQTDGTGASVSPEAVQVCVPAGKTVRAAFDVSPGGEDMPALSVVGTTRLGEFSLVAKPFATAGDGDDD